MTQQTFAIDYDGTYAADTALWGSFIATALSCGHRVLICTGRAFPPTETPHGIEVHCTAGQAKRDYLADLGISVDVWIDDDPASVITDGI